MHFSRPSGHRLSWWRPWNRGAVGTFCSGYWMVSTFRNICRKVTPNPLTESRKSGTGNLLNGAVVPRPPGQYRPGGAATHAVVMRKVQRRGWERGRRWRGDPFVLGQLGLFLGRLRGQSLPPLSRGVPAQEQQDEHHDDPGCDHVQPGAAALPAVHARGRDNQRPRQGRGDEHLPAEPHQLVVPDSRQRAAQPDEEEKEDADLRDEPDQRVPPGVRAGPD